jgi:hypothetical protein
MVRHCDMNNLWTGFSTHFKIGLMALHMDKKGLIEYFKFMGAVFGDMDIQTQAVHGAIDFCVWECMSPVPDAPEFAMPALT